MLSLFVFFFFSSRRRHTRCSRDWSSDVCSSDLHRRCCDIEFVRPRGLDVAATPVFVEHVEAMMGLAVAPLTEPRWKSLALWVLNKGISWRHDTSREHLLYSERELEKIGRMRTLHQTKAARQRQKQERDQAIKAEKVAAKRARELAIKAMKAAAKEQRRT